MLSHEVCSNYISHVGLFNAIFRLTDFSSDPFDFSSSKNGEAGSAQQALSALRAFQLTSLQVCDSQKPFCRLILMVWWAVLRGWLPPHKTLPPHQPPLTSPPIPTPAHRPGCKGLMQPTLPPPPHTPPLPPCCPTPNSAPNPTGATRCAHLTPLHLS